MIENERNRFKFIMLFTGIPAIGSLGYGLYTLISGETHTEQTSGTVKDIKVVNGFRRSDVFVDVEYVVDGKTYTHTFETSKTLSTGNQVTIYYQKNYPEKCSLDSDQTKAIVAIVVGIVLLLVTYGIYKAKTDDTLLNLLIWWSV